MIYKYVLKLQETSKTKYVDFEDCVHIFHNFLPKEISLVESVVACLSDNEVHVFRLKLVDASDDEHNLVRLSDILAVDHPSSLTHSQNYIL